MKNYDFFKEITCDKFNRHGGRYCFTWIDKANRVHKAVTDNAYIWDAITDARYHLCDEGPRPTGMSATSCRKWLISNAYIAKN